MINNKKILVTGATGEVARAITQALAPHNEVWAAARFSNPELKQQLQQQGVNTFTWALGSDDFRGLPDDFNHVIHAAADILSVGNDYNECIRINAEGTGLLLNHVRNAESLFYFSTMNIYSKLEDNSVIRHENDALGCHPSYAPSYSTGKIATEAVVRTLARLFELPSIICRLGMNYGVGCSGAPDFYFQDMLAGKPVVVPPRGKSFCPLIANQDIVDWVEPLLNAATVPATIVNLTGDDFVDEREMCEYMAQIAGLDVEFSEHPDAGYYGGIADTERRRAITGAARPWKESFLEMLSANYPDRQFTASRT